MACVTRADVKVAYEIGIFIASLVPCLDDNHDSNPWAEYKGFFNKGPDPKYYQTKQGIFLQVDNAYDCPHTLLTRYGEWKIFGSRRGNFTKVFEIVKEKLPLRKIEELSTEEMSCWAVEKWNGEVLDEPILANERAGEYISQVVARSAYREFIKTL